MSMSTCLACQEILHPPIISCSNGHAICGTCQADIRTCPECRNDLVFRNTALERILDTIPVFCKFKGQGCTQQDKREIMKTHETRCFYRDVCCYTSECPDPPGMKIPLSQLEVHFNMKHKHQMKMLYPGAYHSQDYVLEDKSFAQVWVIKLNLPIPQYFIYGVRLVNTDRSKKFQVDVRYVGKDEDADKYKYTVSIDQGMGEDELFRYTNYSMPHYNYDRCSIPHRRLTVHDYRCIFKKEFRRGDTFKSRIEIYPSTQPPPRS